MHLLPSTYGALNQAAMQHTFNVWHVCIVNAVLSRNRGEQGIDYKSGGESISFSSTVMPRYFQLAILSLCFIVVNIRPSCRKRVSGVTTSASAANGQTFDYIVVGGGLTGTTVPARLAEDTSVAVLMIEAGADKQNNLRVYDTYQYGKAFQTELTREWPTDHGRLIPG